MATRLILDRYRVIGKAGTGGFATVLHAHDTLLKRDVAIKYIELSENEAARAAGAMGAAGTAGPGPMGDVLSDGELAPAPGGVLPADPTFLDKREERLQSRKDRKGSRRPSAAGFAGGAGTPGIGSRASSASSVSRFPHLSSRAGGAGAADPASTANINALAGELPGTIAGAGQVEIGGIDSAGVQLSVIGAAAGKDAGGGKGAAYSGDVGAGRANVSGKANASGRPGKGRGKAAASGAGASANGGIIGAAALAGMPVVRGATSILGDASGDGAGASLAGLLATFPGLDEARAAAKLNDANIVTVYDCVVEGNCVYMIMEYVEGRTLTRVLRELENDITLDMIAAIFTSVAHALEVAHDSKILHLDIKPENVMISTTGEVKVTDFGLATLMDASGHGKAGAGTIGYMPLEQMQQRSLDVRTDEWALASLTYEMLSGSNPFRAGSLKAAEAAISNAELVLPSQCWMDIDEKIDDVMFMALDPSPEERYSTIKKFDRALKPLLGNAEAGKTQLKAVMAGSGGMAEATDASGEEEGGRGGLFGLFRGKSKDDDPDAAYGADDIDDADGISGGASSKGGSIVGSLGKAAAASLSSRPIIDAIGPRGSSVIMRIVAAGGCSLLTVMALLNMRISTSDMFGILSSTPIAFYVVLAAQLALAIVRPRWGVVMAYAMLSLMFLFNFAWLQGILMLAAAGVWWWFIGRESDSASTVALLQPLCGSFGFATIAPVMAGVELDIRDSLATAAFAAIGAIMFAGLGSCNLNSWVSWEHIMLPGSADLASAALWQGFIDTLTNPCTWMTFISWVVAAGLYSLICRKGTKAFDIIGAVLCAAVLVAGEVVNITALGQGIEPLSLSGVIVCSLLGVLFAAMNIPDRVRLAEGEW